MPNASDYYVSDVVVLADGRVAVFRFPLGGLAPVDVVTIVPGDSRWTSVDLDVTFDDSRIYDWTQAPDGRIYSWAWVINPSGNSWHVEPWEEGLAQDGLAIATGPDGRIYIAELAHQPALLIYDLDTGEWTRSAEQTLVTGIGGLLADTSAVYAVDFDQIASYDVSTDTWRHEIDMWYHNAPRSGLGPGSRIHLLDAWETENPPIYVFESDTGTLAQIPRPVGAASDWNPIFVTGPDGRLWAVDAKQSFAYLGY